jgi:hypothetical protein
MCPQSSVRVCQVVSGKFDWIHHGNVIITFKGHGSSLMLGFQGSLSNFFTYFCRIQSILATKYALFGYAQPLWSYYNPFKFLVIYSCIRKTQSCLSILSTDDLPGSAGAGLPKKLKLRRARPRPSLPPPWRRTSLGGGEERSARGGRLGWACVRAR